MKNSKYKIKVIGNKHGEFNSPISEYTHIRAYDDSKWPWTGQPDDHCSVQLLKPIVDQYQKMINKYGENVGFTLHHCGMGKDSYEFVILEENNTESVEDGEIKLDGTISSNNAIDLIMRASDIIHTLKNENNREVRNCSEWLADFKKAIKYKITENKL
jgi:hypothetical protein